METKFIEGTNNQYLIREDGVVLQCYKYNTELNTVCTTKKISTLNLGIKSSLSLHSTNRLLLKYFGYIICKYCNQKKQIIHSKDKCKTCYKKEDKIFGKSPKKREYSKRYSKNKTKDISKQYTCQILGIKTSELTEELYQLHKSTLKLKREICQKNSITKI